MSMDSKISHTSITLSKCCECGCSCNGSFSGAYLRSVKRKYDEFEQEGKVFTISGFDLPLNALIGIENECNALRETVNTQQQTINDLISELEEERNAASSAAEEAMSMILRLQREKAEIQMEARQFKRFAEEKMAHDQQEMLALEELLYKREEMIESLSCEAHAYKHRMLSCGLVENEGDGDGIYPSLKCKINESRGYGDEEEKYAFGEESPCVGDRLKDLEYRIDQLEKTPRANEPNVLEKVTVGQHLRKFSTGKEDFAAEAGDVVSDRVYVLDSFHQGGGGGDDFKTAPRDSLNNNRGDVRDLEIEKLYARLRVLEADRESMRRAIISIGTDKAQLVLLKEIAQNLCKDKGATMTKQSAVGSFSFVALFKWVISFIFWRRKAQCCRYAFGLGANNVGLRMLLSRGGPLVGQWRRCIRDTAA